MRHFCTYFDHHYLARGLALYDSLRRHCPAFQLWVLCLSGECHDILSHLKLPSVRLISLEELEQADQELLTAKANRSRIEYYFTCTPAFTRFVLRRHPDLDCVNYLDADVYFFADPERIFTEIGDHSIAITPHRFPPALRGHEKYGLFNVGWLTFRRDEQGLACLERWRAECLGWCYDRYEDGKFADQKYLDEWPAHFSRLKILEHHGINAAPWNLGGCHFSRSSSGIQVNGWPLILYHFHGLKALTQSIYDPQWVNYGVRPSGFVRRRIYAPYLKHLKLLTRQLAPLTTGAGRPQNLRPSGNDQPMPAWRQRWHAWRGVLRRKHLFVGDGRVTRSINLNGKQENHSVT